MISLAARSTAGEQMDESDLDAETYARVLHDLAAVNGITLARRPTLRFLARALGTARSFSLLDVGFGAGDMLRSIAGWAGAQGYEARLEGVDLNPKSAPIARAGTSRSLRIAYRTGDYAATPGPFDFVVSSLVAHHMQADELVAFLRWMEANATRGWMVNDLHRHRLAYLGYPLLARIMRWHRIVREDGTLSIARSFRPMDWHALLAQAEIAEARVVRRFPFRLCVERIR